MSQTTHRVLRLLGLLEARPSWSGDELAARLETTPRTVRRDVARLRDLGYPVESERGTAGGYRLGAGRQLPPLVLDDDEAVALVACLRMAALSGQDSIGEAALRALAKLDQVLPPRLRALATALDAATEVLPRQRPAVDWRLLAELARAQRGHHLVRFRYTKPDGCQDEREVEPARLATQGEHWYLQGFDRVRDDWRIFRLDRMAALEVTTWTFGPREAPSLEFERSLASRYPCVVEVGFGVPADVIARRVPAPHREALVAHGDGCRVRLGGGSWDDLAWHVLWICRDLRTSVALEAGGVGVAQLTDAVRAVASDAMALLGEP